MASSAAAQITSRASVGGPKAFYSAELETKAPMVPREDLTKAMTSDKTVQQCLRDSLRNSGDDFSVTLNGAVSVEGKISNVRADTYSSPPLAQCMQDAVREVKLKTPGTAGEFQITIQRHRVTGGAEAKTFMLDLNEPVK